MSRAGAPRAPRTPPGDKRGPPNWGSSPCWGPPGQGTRRRCRAGCVCACFVVVLWAAPRARGCGAVPPGGRRGGGHHPAAEQGASGLAQPGPAAHPPPHPTPFTPPAAPGPCCLSWGRFSRGSFSALPVAAVPCRPGAVPPTLRRLAFQEQDKQGAQGGAPPPPPFSAGQGRGGMLGVVPLPPPSSVSRNDLVSLWWGSGVWPRPPPACPAVCNSVVCHENDRAAQPAACLFFSIPLAPGGA